MDILAYTQPIFTAEDDGTLMETTPSRMWNLATTSFSKQILTNTQTALVIRTITSPRDDDTTVNCTIAVRVRAGENDIDNDVRDNNNAAVAATVKNDSDKPLVGVIVTSKVVDDTLVYAATTNAAGVCTFRNIEPSTFYVRETNARDYQHAVSDQGDSHVNCPNDRDKTVDYNIEVVVLAGELDTDENFVNINKGPVMNQVTGDSNEPLTAVIVKLEYPNTTVVSVATSTDSNRLFNFTIPTILRIVPIYL